MDADRIASASRQLPAGGAVEPEHRAPPGAAPARGSEHFELRDRVADVVYRAGTFSDMAAKAEELGSTLIVAVSADGKRTSIQKVDGQWQRGLQRPASTAMPAARVISVGTAREATETAGGEPMTTAAVPRATDPVEVKARPRLAAKAERAEFVAGLEAALSERYVVRRAPVSIGDFSIGRTEYLFRGDPSRVAFTESNLRLATDTNHPSVARSMVDVAQVRGWRVLRVSGHEDFKRQVWLEASVRGLKTLGHEPTSQDLALLQREREARLVNRIEPAAQAAASPPKAAQKAVEKSSEDAAEKSSTTAPDKASNKASTRDGGGRKTVLAAVEALLVAQRVPQSKRAEVMAAASEKLAQLASRGEVPRVKLHDSAAPVRAVAGPTPDFERTRERAGPAPQR